MKRFVTRILIFCILIIAVDRLIAWGISHFRPSDYGAFIASKSEYFESKPEKDLLIFGDSHVADAIDPRILEAKLNKESYNLGVYHTGPHEYYYLMAEALATQSKDPDLVLLGTNPTMFNRQLKISKYTPLIMRNLACKANLAIATNGWAESGLIFKSTSESYLFPQILKRIRGKKYIPTRQVDSLYNGFLYFQNQIPGTDWDNFSPKEDGANYNPIQVDYFTRTIDTLKSRGIKVVIVNPPIYEKHRQQMKSLGALGKFEKLLDSIAEAKDVPVFNADHKFRNGEVPQNYFLNAQHLNFKGAKVFTSDLGKFLAGREQVD